MSDIDILTTPATADEIFETFLSMLETMSVPARSWRKGGTMRTALRAMAIFGGGISQMIALAIASGFFDTCPDNDWLTLLAKKGYDVTRRQATFASGYEQFTNTGGGVFDFDPGEVRVKSSSSGKVYVNTEAFHLDPGDVKLVAISAVEIGSASTAAPGDIDELETTILLVTVTNPESVLGFDAAAKDEVVELCHDKLGSLSPGGPKGAYAYFAKTNADGTPIATSVPVTRTLVVTDPSTGEVTVYVASASGPMPDDDIAIIQANIDTNAEPECVIATATNTTAHHIDVAATAYVKTTSLLDSQIEDAITARITAYFPKIPIAGFTGATANQVFRSAIEGQGYIALPDMEEFVVTTPSGDTTLLGSEVPVLDSVTITVVRV